MTSETSLLYYVSCHQSYRISLTFTDPVFLFESSHLAEFLIVYM